MRVGILGATGYTGHELLSIFARHPDAQLAFVTSETYAGQRFSDVYPSAFDNLLVPPGEAPLDKVDVAFLCTPHGASATLAARVLASGARCVDLSADFRLRDRSVYEEWYGAHPEWQLQGEAVYGLTELYRQEIAGARLVANPGCYPTGPLLSLYPLLRSGAVTPDRIIIDAASGVSGAGAKPSAKTHYVSVHDNYSAYNVGHAHRHVPEMEQEIRRYGGQARRIVFSPHLLPVSRGILSTIYVSLEPSWTAAEVVALWRDTFVNDPFIQVLAADKLATLAHVVNTNRCTLSVTTAGAPGEFIIVTAIDNLIKGASGQAVQNMNVMFGLDETLGL